MFALTRVTEPVPLMEKELLPILDPMAQMMVGVAQSLVLCVVFYPPLFAYVSFFFWVNSLASI
jgi:hypothetical protein